MRREKISLSLSLCLSMHLSIYLSVYLSLDWLLSVDKAPRFWGSKSGIDRKEGVEREKSAVIFYLLPIWNKKSLGSFSLYCNAEAVWRGRVTVWFLAGCTLLCKAVTWASHMPSRALVLETYGGVHLPGVWSRNGHGGGSGAALSKSAHCLPPPFPVPLLLQRSEPRPPN